MDVSNNLVNSIDILKQFKSLRVIKARKCFIIDVNLNLPKLEVLDLWGNYIMRFPTLSEMNRLHTLILANNKIVEFKQFNVELCPAISHLDISENPTLKFPVKRDFLILLNKLKKMKLTILNIDAENINQYNGIEELVKLLPNLEKLNGDRKDMVQKKVQRVKKHDADNKILLTT